MKGANIVKAIGLLFIVCLTIVAASATADEFQDSSKLFKQGDYDKAFTAIEGYLSAHPNDARGRFLKGLILTEQNKASDAIEVFSQLTKDYPELPEPYNNLAVLYASQGHHDKALAALETAIRTHPSYAIAHENLGDVYAQLASQAYDKALQLDKKNTAAQTKLALIKELFSQNGQDLHPAVIAQAAPKSSIEPAPVKSISEPAPAKSAHVAAPPAITNNDEKTLVLKAVMGWAHAWSHKDASGYLEYYAVNFTPPEGQKRNAWEASRKERIQRPKQIQVSVLSPHVILNDEKNAVVQFEQDYRSDSLNRRVRKSLTMIKSEGKWQIVREQVGK